MKNIPFSATDARWFTRWRILRMHVMTWRTTCWLCVKLFVLKWSVQIRVRTI